MKKIYFILSITSSFSISAQVGIGTNTPHNSAQLEISSTSKGILFPRLTTVQRTGIASPAPGLYVWDTNTKSLWYFDGVIWINTVSEATFGDVKSGFQVTDHSGWIILDGRAISTLSAAQQAVSVSLGFSTNLPDASATYLVQNGGGMGAVTGANTVTLNQGNLPNVNFAASASNAGSHNHTTDPAAFNSATAGNHNHTTDPAVVNTGNAGAHDHLIDPPSTNTTFDGNHNHQSYYRDPNNGSGFNGGVGGGGWFGISSNATSTDGIHNHILDIPVFNSASNGVHNHSVDIPSTGSSTDGSHDHIVDVPSTTSNTEPDHTHTITVSSGGSATPVNIAPKSMSVNMFIYLGQ